LPDGHGFSVELSPLPGGSESWLAVTRKAEGSLELFTSMAADIAEALSTCPEADEPRALATLLGRVRAWQEFMRKGAGELTAEEEIGLFGELWILAGLVDAGIDVAAACSAWGGPLGELRDFEIGTGGIEVKTTLSSTSFRASIGSLDQLDDSARQPLFLAGVRLVQSHGGDSLPEGVDRMRDIVRGDAEAERLLVERLLAAGYRDEHAPRYARRFQVVGTRVLRIDPSFPRLTRGTVPRGIVRAKYDVDLDLVEGESVALGKALNELGAISNGS
jgi:hypothetical protein